MLKGRRRRKEEEEEERGGGVGVDDKRWLRVTSGFQYIEMKSLLLWFITIDLINEAIDLINETIDHDHNNRL